ncbi:MAG: demethoxyubiquinone hydroxylase family protein [Gammaproteobacteria bacterium]
MNIHYLNTRALSIPPFETLELSPSLIADLRSDHAGETGAVEIYRGMLAVTRDPAVREFAENHIEAERRHLEFFENWIPKTHLSRLLPVWRLAGWTLGAGSALFGRQAVFATIAAVESFVETHYLDQIGKLETDSRFNLLRTKLQEFCNEEVHHRDDANSRADKTDGVLHRGWARLVEAGSALGVTIARKI